MSQNMPTKNYTHSTQLTHRLVDFLKKCSRITLNEYYILEHFSFKPNEVRVACYILGHWENKQTDGVTIGACREGMLMYKDQPSYMGLGGAKWKPGFFVLKYLRYF